MNKFFRMTFGLKGAVTKFQFSAVTYLMLIGCSDNAFNFGGENGLDHIPLSSGSSWSYIRFDSVAAMEDTVIFNIIGQVISIHGDTGIEIEKVDSTVNKSYAIMDSDTLSFISDLEPPIIVFGRFVLPLKVGNQWLGNSQFDSVRVVSRETVEVPAGVFKETYRVERKSWIFNQTNQTTYWIAPGIGIVKKHVHNFGLSETKIELWNLLSYSVPE